MQYYKGEHGIHISYNPAEREGLEATGWTLIGDQAAYEASRKPKSTNRLSVKTYADMDIDELRSAAKDKGIIVHHKAGKATIIEKLESI